MGHSMKLEHEHPATSKPGHIHHEPKVQCHQILAANGQEPISMFQLFGIYCRPALLPTGSSDWLDLIRHLPQGIRA